MSFSQARITCNHGAVGTVQSMGHHYARIHLHKDDLNLLQYNFRINVTLIGMCWNVLLASTYAIYHSLLTSTCVIYHSLFTSLMMLST